MGLSSNKGPKCHGLSDLSLLSPLKLPCIAGKSTISGHPIETGGAFQDRFRRNMTHIDEHLLHKFISQIGLDQNLQDTPVLWVKHQRFL
jgi:hypothetical protein